jgi:hypothetical protein
MVSVQVRDEHCHLLVETDSSTLKLNLCALASIQEHMAPLMNHRD